MGKLGILAEKVLHECIQQLLLDSKKKIGKAAGTKDMSEDLECLSQIMCTCGRLLDSDMARGLMDQYFSRMKVLADNPELPRRIRFMLRDVIELRGNNWVPRKATTVEGPMPMHQIRDDSDPPSRSYTPPSRGGDGGRSGGGGGLVSSMGMTDYFRPPPGKMRPGGFDDMGYGYPSVGGPNQPLISPRFGNGYSGRDGGRDGGHHNNNNNNNRGNFRGQNFQNHGKNNYHHNHHNYNNSSVKELGPRLKKCMNDADNTNLDDVQLRPSANSMLFKQTATKQPMLNSRSSGMLGPTPGRGVNILNEPINPPKAHTPLLHKEQPILIKQASQDKNKNAKKDKGPNKEEVLKKVHTMMEEYMKNNNVDEALSAYREHKIPDRFIAAVLHAILSHVLDKSGMLIFASCLTF